MEDRSDLRDPGLPADPVPTLSVLLATRDRAAMLESTLRAFERLDVRGLDWEILVADNGSGDATTEVLAAAAERLPIRSIHVAEPGKNRALNRTLPLARGQLLVFTDDDVLPCGGWLRELVAAAGRWPAASVFGGRIGLALPPGTPSWVEELPHLAALLGVYEPLAVEGRTAIAPVGPNFAVRASALVSRRFEESIGPDGSGAYAMGSETELLLRMHREGETIVYVPGAEVRHVVRPEQLERDALLERSYRFGRGWARMHPEEGGPRLLGAPRWLWRSWVEERVRALLGFPRAGAAHMGASLLHRRYSGQIREYRAMHAAQAYSAKRYSRRWNASDTATRPPTAHTPE